MVAMTAEAESAYDLDDFAAFCLTLKLDTGRQFVLEDYQRLMLGDYFAGATETAILIPKKNGKTTLLGALALYHLMRTPEADCIIAASSRDQARILFKQAAGLVKRSGLPLEVKSGYGIIWPLKGDREGPTIKVISADANTGDGAIPTLALVDELHRHPSGELYGVLRDGLGPKNGQLITISTAGASMDSPLGVLRKAAHELPSFRRDPDQRYNYAVSPDRSFVMHEWCLDEEDDVDDMDVVKLANPASWHTLEALRRRHDSPSTTPWQWLRFACGIWTEGEEPWIEPVKWDRLGDSSATVVEGDSIWLGLSIGTKQERTDIVLCRVDGEDVVVNLHSILPAPGEERVPLSVSEDAVRRFCSKYNVHGVVYISVGFQRSAEILEEEGYPMIEMPQTPSRLEPASATVFALVEESRLKHDADPAFRAQVLAGRVKETERGWRFRSDPAAAALLCLAAVSHTAINEETNDPQVFVF